MASINTAEYTRTPCSKAEEKSEMEASSKCFHALGFILIIGITTFSGSNAAGECPRSTPDMELMKLVPCLSAALDANAAVSRSCCTQVQKLGQNPRCLCAVLLSNTAKNSGVNAEIAITIPKRCNLVDRPVGYKCGAYILP